MDRWIDRWVDKGCNFVCCFFVFQSGALFLAVCYILGQKHVLCWMDFGTNICHLHCSSIFSMVLLGFSMVFIDLPKVFTGFSIVFIELSMVTIDFSMVSIDFSLQNMHLVNM